MLKNKIIIVSLILLAGILWGFLHYSKFALERSSSVNAYSKNAMGLSIFDELGDNRLSKKLTPFFKKSELEHTDLLLILSPQMPISLREANVISHFVSDGGSLIISFHNESSLTSLSTVLNEFKLPAAQDLTKDQGFRNKQAQFIEAHNSLWLFEAGANYSMYSNLLFNNEGCKNRELDCYVVHKSFGSGQVTLISGLVPFINGLITENNNSDIANALHDKYSNIVTDEYHHFFSEKNMLDLLLTSQVTLPILGLILAALLFFLFGYNQLDNEGLLDTKLRSVRSYHDINRAILNKIIKLPGSEVEAKEIILKCLPEYFPTRVKEIESLKDKDILTIAKFHLTELQRRRGNI